MSKPALLFLCHRIPYPPNKGDKIRSYHLLRYLCRFYRVYLACFIDDEKDVAYVEYLQKLCEESVFIRLNPNLKKLVSLTAFFSGQPMTVPYYYDAKLKDWVVRKVASHNIHRCVVYSSSMGQYLKAHVTSQLRSVIDLVDVDSDKWRQYAKKKLWPLSWVYRREANLLLEVERDLIARSEKSLLVSSSEANLMRKLSPGLGSKIDYYNNGVDATFFDPSIDLVNPYPQGKHVLVFTGAMDYWPNIDAVRWFVKTLFPAIRSRYPEIEFYIVGRNPVRDVTNLSRQAGVVVTGAVEDVRPYLKYATATIAPLRIARGIQNKVLEAMAMENRVMASSQALEGINAERGAEVLLANTLEDYLEYLPKIIAGDSDSMGERARECILRKFDWESSLPIVSKFLESDELEEYENDGI